MINNHIDECGLKISSLCKNVLYACILCRHSSIKSTPPTVMYGAMVWCCLRSGQSERSHFQRLLTKKF